MTNSVKVYTYENNVVTIQHPTADVHLMLDDDGVLKVLRNDNKDAVAVFRSYAYAELVPDPDAPGDAPADDGGDGPETDADGSDAPDWQQGGQEAADTPLFVTQGLGNIPFDSTSADPSAEIAKAIVDRVDVKARKIYAKSLDLDEVTDAQWERIKTKFPSQANHYTQQAIFEIM